MVRNEDYRGLFTSKKTVMNKTLGSIYHVPVSRPDGGWEPFEFGKDDPRGGLLTQVGFLAVNAHPGRSSATR